MSGVMLQDGGRPGKRRWYLDTISRGDAAGVVLSPFFSPKVPLARRPSARDLVDTIGQTGGTVLLDPTTHGARMPSSNYWDCYDTWDLWDGARGDLRTPALQEGHVRRVLDAQRGLGLPAMAPTVTLESSVGATTDLALGLATLTGEVAGLFWASIVGTGAFWTQGQFLDDYVGQIVQLRPVGVTLTVQRPAITYPPGAIAEEVEGVCRTVHSLSLRSEVIVQHGDLFGLPALAAGANWIGTGWDLRQRVFAPDGLRRDTTTRRSAKRLTHGGIFGVLKRPEAERLAASDRTLSLRLVPGVLPPDGNALWEHHISVISRRAASLLAMPDRQSRVAWLSGEYVAATRDFRLVDRLVGRLEFPSTTWLDAVTGGLAAYRAGEGW